MTLPVLQIARLSGLPCSATLGQSWVQLKQALESFRSRRAERDRLAHDLSESLFREIGNEEDARRRSALLRIRRGLFNARIPSAADVALISASASSNSRQIAEAIAHATAALDACRCAEQQVAREFGNALRHARTKVREALIESRFRDGLLLSSASLYANLARYLRSGDRLSAKESQTERGILRYLTRASMKATPFAAFCSIVPVRFSNTLDGSTIRFAGSMTTRRSVVRLNKMLGGQLWRFVKSDRELRRRLHVELNPTLRSEDGAHVFLFGLGEREVFQRLSRESALDTVVEFLRARSGDQLGVIVRDLANEETIEATQEEVETFLDGLLALGLARFQNPVQAQEADWAPRLADALPPATNENADRLSTLLRYATEITREYRDAETEQRERLGEELRTRVESTLRLMPGGGQHFSLPLLYEDMGVEGEVVLRDTPALRDATRRLRSFAARMLPIAFPRAAMMTMRHHFDNAFPEPDAAVPLLAYYEQFYREHFKEHLTKLARLRAGGLDESLKGYSFGNPFDVAAIKQVSEAHIGFTNAIRTAWAAESDAHEIALSTVDLPALNDVPPASASLPASVSMFGQWVEPTGGRGPFRFVCTSGQMFLGFGKYFSRFLHVLPEETTTEIREQNDAYANVMLAEIAGDADFNANLHPRLLPWEIAYPTGDGELTDGLIRCEDLEVTRDPASAHGLVIRHRSSGRLLLPLDLGFLNVQRRPALYQMLTRFAPIGAVNVSVPFSARADESERTLTRILRRPRLVLDDCLVIARERWSVPAALFPRPEPGESDLAFFMRVDQWRVVHGIPTEVYVRVNPIVAPPTAKEGAGPELAAIPVPDAEDGGDDAQPDRRAPDGRTAEQPKVSPAGTAVRSRPSRDYAKPQYIDFSNPLLVDLFGRLPGGLANFTLHIEERYPDAASCAQANGQPYATEFIVQFDNLLNIDD